MTDALTLADGLPERPCGWTASLVEQIVNAFKLRAGHRILARGEQEFRAGGADADAILERYIDRLTKITEGYDLDGNLTPVAPRRMNGREVQKG